MFDGYLSDFYFVEGKTLEPTAFGQFFEGKWGPLDESKVKENIDAAQRKQPYDSRANTDQVWSSQVTPANANTAKAFDADMTQGAVDTAFAWNTNITNVEKLEIYTQANALNPDTYSTLEVNGEDKSADLVSGNGWNTISNPPATLTSINTNYASTNERIDVYGIRVNGRLLVDQSVWDNSQNWSGGDVTGGGPLNLPWSNAFDGDLSTRPNVSSGTSTLTFTTPLDINGKTVEIYAQGGTTGAGKLTFNGKEWSGGGITSNQWIDITSVFAGDTTFDSITLDFESNPAYLWAIRVDGAVLVDAGDQYNTSQVWSETFTATNPPSGNDPSKLSMEFSSLITVLVLKFSLVEQKLHPLLA